MQFSISKLYSTITRNIQFGLSAKMGAQSECITLHYFSKKYCDALFKSHLQEYSVLYGTKVAQHLEILLLCNNAEGHNKLLLNLYSKYLQLKTNSSTAKREKTVHFMFLDMSIFHP